MEISKLKISCSSNKYRLLYRDSKLKKKRNNRNSKIRNKIKTIKKGGKFKNYNQIKINNNKKKQIK